MNVACQPAKYVSVSQTIDFAGIARPQICSLGEFGVTFLDSCLVPRACFTEPPYGSRQHFIWTHCRAVPTRVTLNQ